MTFEEFFKKKRIDLVALEQGGQSLFSEFKNHFEQMGEKSFDHTKKYWFNKLRRQYPLAPEVKTEKVHIDNPLAEQTITESLSEATATPAPSPKLGFAPKFRAGNMPKPAPADKKEETVNPPDAPAATENLPDAAPAPKLGFVPKFKAGVTAKAVSTTEDKKEEPLNPPVVEANSENSQIAASPSPSPKLGFKPKFKAATIPKPAENAENKAEPASPPAVEETTSEQIVAPTTPSETIEAKPAYKPKFNMRNLPPKPKE